MLPSGPISSHAAGAPQEAPSKAHTHSIRESLRMAWSFRAYSARFILPAIGLLILAFLQADLASTAARGTNVLLNRFDGQGTAAPPSASSVTAVGSDQVYEIPLEVARQYAVQGPPTAPIEEQGRSVTPAGWLFDRTGPDVSMVTLAAIIALFLVLALTLRILSEQVRGIVSERFRHRVQTDVVAAMSRELAATRGMRDPGNSSQIFVNDAAALSSLTIFGFVSAAESLLMMGVYALSLSRIPNGLTILFGLFPLLVLFQVGVAALFHRHEMRTVQRSERLNVQLRLRVNEFFDVLGRLVYSKGERNQAERVLRLSRDSAVAGRRFQFVSSLSGGVSELGTTLALPLVTIALTLPLLVQLLPAGTYSAGTIVEVQMLLAALTASSGALVGIRSQLTGSSHTLHRLRDVLSVPEVGPRPGELDRLKASASPPTLRVENVCFRYPSAARDVLRGVDFDIPAGCRVGLVGGSGGGKSTLARLLLGDYHPTSGRILYDGTDVTTWHMWWRRELIGFLPAEQGFIRGTLEENVLFGRSLEDVHNYQQALEISGVAKFAQERFGGMRTPIDRKVEDVLSTGERRRVGIARLLIGDQPLWVFDEPGASLDQNEMRRVARVLGDATMGRTSIIITHDPDVFVTDLVVFLLNGTVGDVGTHQELLRRNAGYRALVERFAAEREEQEREQREREQEPATPATAGAPVSPPERAAGMGSGRGKVPISSPE